MIWATLAALASGMLLGIMPSSTFLFLLLFAAVEVQAGALVFSSKAFPLDIGLTASLAALVLTLVPVVSDLTFLPPSLRERLRSAEGAGAGLLLAALAGSGVFAIVGGRPPGSAALAIAITSVCLCVTAAQARMRGLALPYDRLILLGAAVATAVMPVLSNGRSSPWSLWIVIVPTLMVAAAGHVQGRRALFGWALSMAVIGLLGIVWTSGNLILAPLHMLGAGALALGAAQAARRLSHVWRAEA